MRWCRDNSDKIPIFPCTHYNFRCERKRNFNIVFMQIFSWKCCCKRTRYVTEYYRKVLLWYRDHGGRFLAFILIYYSVWRKQKTQHCFSRSCRLHNTLGWNAKPSVTVPRWHQGHALPPGSSLLHFHAIFDENWPKYYISPRSATDFTQNLMCVEGYRDNN